MIFFFESILKKKFDYIKNYSTSLKIKVNDD